MNLIHCQDRVRQVFQDVFKDNEIVRLIFSNFIFEKVTDFDIDACRLLYGIS